MSQRLTNARLRRVLGHTPNGEQIYPIRGAEDNGTGENVTSTDSDSSKDGGEGDGNTDSDKSKTDTNTDGDGSVSREEYEALKRRMQQADRNFAAARKKLDDAEKAKLDAQTRAERERDEARKTADDLAEQVQQYQIRVKFLGFNKYEWHDPETALALVDLSEVEISEDGKVSGLDTAMKRLANSKPFLLKPKDEQGQPKNKSGETPSGGSKSKSDQASSRESLERKYPGLVRGRIPFAG
jgi:hypothetical protein